MLPSVSDVVRELSLTTNADTPTLFKAARHVCAEELNRVKQGFESEPLDVLVRRAERLIDPSLLKSSAPAFAPAEPKDTPQDDLFAAAAPIQTAEPHTPSPGEVPSTLEVPAPAADEPFAETAAVMDLGWSPEMSGPFATVEPSGPVSPLGVPSQDIRSEIDEGPGEDTLARLTREAAAMDLQAVIPLVPVGPTAPVEEPVPAVPEPEASEAFAPEPEPYEDAAWAPRAEEQAVEPPSEPRPSAPAPRRESTLVLTVDRPRRTGLVVAAVLALAAVGSALYFGMGRRAAKPKPPVTEVPAAEAPAEESASAAAAEPATSPSTAVPAAPEPAAVQAAVSEPAPKKEARAATAPPKREAPPAPIQKTTEAIERPAVKADVPAGTKPRAAVCASPDWKDRAPVYAIHFGSHTERPNAEREAAALAKRLEMPTHALEVDLGAKGVWYRSFAGEFATLEEAKAARAELEAKHTPNMGFVYYVVGTK